MDNNKNTKLIDKIMTVGFRILCTFTACCILLGCIQSCSVKASAEDYAEQFRYVMSEEIDRLSTAFEVGMVADGVLGMPQGSSGLAIYAIMNSYEYFLMKYTSGSPASVGGSADNSISGIYIYDNKYYPCTLSTNPERLADSPLFGISLTKDDNVLSYEPVPADFTATYPMIGTKVAKKTSSGQFVQYIDKTGHFQPNQFYVNTNTGAIVGYEFYLSASTPPDITSTIGSINNSRTFPAPTKSSGRYKVLMAYVCESNIPELTINPSSPWDSYNNTLRPYIFNTYGDTPEIRALLPFNGNPYVPGHDPNEPPKDEPIYSPSTPNGTPVIVGTGVEVSPGLTVFAPIANQFTVNGVALIFGAAGAVGAAGAAGLAEGQVSINGQAFDLPALNLDVDGHQISIPNKSNFTFDGFDFIINPDGSLSIGDLNFNFPVGEPETNPEIGDYVYYYQIETFDEIYIPAATMPSFTPSQFYDDVQGVWVIVYDFLTELELMPLVGFSLAIGALSFVLWEMGGK